MILETNLKVLLEIYPQLYKRIKGFQANQRISVFETKNGHQTIKVKTDENGVEKQIFLHSKYNPQAEGQKFAEENMLQQKDNNVLIGFGMGYHVESLVDLLKEGNHLVVFDTNIDVFAETLKYRDLTAIFLHPQVKLIISDDLKEITSKLSPYFNIMDMGDVNFITHVPSISAIEGKFEDFRLVLLELNLRKTANTEYLDLMMENAQYNRGKLDKNVGLFFQKFKGMPIIIVCAGPSLDKNKHLLKGLEDKAVIICVGHALKSLVNIGVRPHFIISIDPQDIIYKQIEGLEDLDIPLILLASAAKIMTERYLGPKLFASQFTKFLKAGEEGYLVRTGGSVSTTALDIAIKMGGNPIVFIGQDLAYLNNQHHCADTFHAEKDIQRLNNMRTVKGQNGDVLNTTLGMLSFKRWIENRILEEDKLKFINASEGGAVLSGFQHLGFQETINQYIKQQYPIEDIINGIVNNNF